MTDNSVYPNYSWVLKGLHGADEGLKFFSATLPHGQIELSTVKAFGEGGKVARCPEPGTR